MPPEAYLGAAAGVIVLILLASLFRRRPAPRRAVQNGGGTDQLAIQLSRIADALEVLAVRLGAASPPRVEQIEQPPEPSPALNNPRVEQPPAPLRKSSEPPAPLQQAPEPSGAEREKTGEPAKPHVSLSMFGR